MFDETNNINNIAELSLEQEFSIRAFEQQVQQMSREQAQGFLIYIVKCLLIKISISNCYKSNGIFKKKYSEGFLAITGSLLFGC